MATCLIALGSNLGDRAATLDAAGVQLNSLPATRLIRHSRYHCFPSIGGPSGQPDFLNAAAVLETDLAPLVLFEYLLQIETDHGRRRQERWSARTLDIDLLLYEDQIFDNPYLVVPHPRMSFRRFVLKPAADVAPQLVHPIIGMSIDSLAQRLDSECDCAAIVSPSPAAHDGLASLAIARFAARPIEPPLRSSAENETRWPRPLTTWLSFAPVEKVGRELPGPKLTVLVDPLSSHPTTSPPFKWIDLRQLPGRGPTLWIRSSPLAAAASEFSAAIESVWTCFGAS